MKKRKNKFLKMIKATHRKNIPKNIKNKIFSDNKLLNFLNSITKKPILNKCIQTFVNKMKFLLKINLIERNNLKNTFKKKSMN